MCAEMELTLVLTWKFKSSVSLNIIFIRAENYSESKWIKCF